jgi:hypothetical protein
MAARASDKGITYVAFTATPKAKTLELFGRRPNPGQPASATNLPKAFHVYSMRQAIEEGFILDVLKNYTPYRLAFRLALNGQDYEILSRIVANPTSMKEALKSGAGVRPLRTAFQALRDLTQNDVSQLAGSLGFRARAGSPFAPRGAGGTVNVRWKGKVKAIPAEKLQEALAAGAEEVQ